ncbi:MAG TPA: PQQ-binding-like beta-propeller repeat protein [Desulfuromonadales bacterium]|nr:PQQ-binding-like beta-propeller repeat protein [Desulfuromonadales bacterium]
MKIVAFFLQIILFGYASFGFAEGLPRLVVQTGHGGDVTALAISPDSRLAISGDRNGGVVLWHLATGRQLLAFAGHKIMVKQALFLSGRAACSTDFNGNVRCWNPADGAMLSEFTLDGEGVLAASPDGTTLAVASTFGLARVIDPLTGKVVSATELPSPVYQPTGIAFINNGKSLVISRADGTLWRWETEGDKPPLCIHQGTGRATALAASPDRQSLLVGWEGGRASLHAADGTVIWQQQLDPEKVNDIAGISWLGKHLGAASNGYQAILFSTDRGSSRATLSSTGFNDYPQVVTATRDGALLLTGDHDGALTVWSAGGERRNRLTAAAEPISGVAVVRRDAEDKGRLLVGTTTQEQGFAIPARGGIRVWDLAGGSEIQLSGKSIGTVKSLTSRTGGREALAILTRSRETLTGMLGHEDILLRINPEGVESGGSKTAISAVRCSTGADRCLSAEYVDNSPAIVAASAITIFAPDTFSTGPRLGDKYVLMGQTIMTVAEGGSRALTGAIGLPIRVWSLNTGAETARYDGHAGYPVAAALSPDGKRAVSFGRKPLGGENTLHLWVAATGALTRKYPLPFEIDSLMFLDMDRVVAVSGHDIYEIDLTGGAYINFNGVLGGSARDMVLSPDRRHLFIADSGNSVGVWSLASRILLARLISLPDGTWAVVAPDGRFDTNNLEEIKGLHWVMPDDPFTPIPIELFMRDYYEPRLLAKLMNNTKLPPVKPMLDTNRVQPQVVIDKVEPVAGQPTQVKVTVTAKQMERNLIKSGLRDLRLFRDSQLAGYADYDLPLDSDGKFSRTFTVTLPHMQEPRKEASFTAHAFNNGQIKSQTSNKVSVDLPKGTPLRKAYIIAIGAADYNVPIFKALEFPPADAAAYIDTLSRSLVASGTYSKENIIPVPLTNNGTWNEKKGKWENNTYNLAKRDIIKGVLERLAGKNSGIKLPDNITSKLQPVTPNDLVIIAFSGHGYPPVAKSGDFLLATTDELPDINRPADTYINTDTLSSWLRDIAAGSITLIIDACHSAGAVDNDYKPGPMGSSGLGQLAYDKGIRILAGTQVDNFANEYPQIGHGLLTYTLLEEGLNAGKAKKDDSGLIAMKQWLDYGVSEVPRIYGALESGNYRTPKGAIVRAGNLLKKLNITTQRPALFDFRRTQSDELLSVIK